MLAKKLLATLVASLICASLFIGSIPSASASPVAPAKGISIIKQCQASGKCTIIHKRIQIHPQMGKIHPNDIFECDTTTLAWQNGIQVLAGGYVTGCTSAISDLQVTFSLWVIVVLLGNNVWLELNGNFGFCDMGFVDVGEVIFCPRQGMFTYNGQHHTTFGVNAVWVGKDFDGDTGRTLSGIIRVPIN